MIRRRFGTVRGAVRLGLSYVQVAGARGYIRRSPIPVTRFVFVCQGNICRSAFADVVARRAGFDAISVGLSTSPDQPAHPPAQAVAAALGVDLSAHRTTRVEDYVPQDGDLLLAMEVRQLARLAANPRLAAIPRSLLGLWARPRTPHLHDPFGLDDAYMRTCLIRIRGAVDALTATFPGAALSRSSPQSPQ